MNIEQRSERRVWLIVLVVIGTLVVIGAFLGPPFLKEIVNALNAGVGLKTAALWSFGVSVLLLIVFAVAAGDGLIGELQFILSGFFLFFIIITFLIAWIF